MGGVGGSVLLGGRVEGGGGEGVRWEDGEGGRGGRRGLWGGG